MSEQSPRPLSLVLFSGTEDRLQAAAVLTAGAAALGAPVHVFLQYWALDAFRADGSASARRSPPRRAPRGRRPSMRCALPARRPGSETLRQAKDIGDVDIQACSLSMDLLNLEPTDLDPLVDGVEGVTAFYRQRRRRPDRLHLSREGARVMTLTSMPTRRTRARSTRRGLKCPMPIVKTAQAIKTLASGELLEVLATDPGSVADFAAWSRGHRQRARERAPSTAASTASSCAESEVDDNHDRHTVRSDPDLGVAELLDLPRQPSRAAGRRDRARSVDAEADATKAARDHQLERRARPQSGRP